MRLPTSCEVVGTASCEVVGTASCINRASTTASKTARAAYWSSECHQKLMTEKMTEFKHLG
jgi:Tfp pilus assembly protein PilV